jgi:hypothetical protein
VEVEHPAGRTDDKARLGRWVLIAVIAVLAAGELALAGFSLQAGRFKGQQITRVLLTGWLLWRVWDGAGWARWLMAGFCLAGAVFAVAVGFGSPRVTGRPEILALVAGLGVVSVMLGLGLASPWVGAYQASRRAEQVAA